MEEFSIKFQKFSELVSFMTFFINLFNSTDEDVSTKMTAYFQINSPGNLELEIINIRNDIFRSHRNNETFWNLVDKNSYSFIRKCTLEIHSHCCSTYSCKSLFSNMKYLKSKYRLRLSDPHLDHCLWTGNATYVPDYSKLAENTRCQISL